ncbi:uncharacterized protein LOC132205206 [Neocloeon triangulifer]|uniref:uncharacterized protein LOC132205206 n=1 Tax=Neocloeon triangulifer TaxID=2078957 RepID=UPI00286ED09F|nr:uncharacterized protein LOC132205206 [Neocloeon triangulifer]
MNFNKVLLLNFLIILALISCECKRDLKARGKSRSILRINTRKAIVNCCGYSSCLGGSSKSNVTTHKTRTVSRTNEKATSGKTIAVTDQISNSETAAEASEVSNDEISAPEEPSTVQGEPTESSSQADNGFETPSSTIGNQGVSEVPTTKPNESPTTESTIKASVSATSSDTTKTSTTISSNTLMSTSETPINNLKTSVSTSAAPISASSTLTSKTSASTAVTSTEATLITTSKTSTGASTTSPGPSTTSTSASTSSSSTSTTFTSTTSTTTTTVQPEVPYNCSHTLSTCQKNSSLLMPDSSVADAQSYGYWNEACGVLFLFGKSVVDWETNFKRCCSLGMAPIAIENATKYACMNKLIPKWDYSLNYWTSARHNLPIATYEFCSPQPISIATKSAKGQPSMWATGEPNNPNQTQDCVHMVIDQTLNLMQLTAKNCKNSFVFACQGTPTTAPPCFAPKCPSYNCKKDLTLFTQLADGKTSYLTKPADHGIWFTVNERSYVFSTASKNWSDANSECCRIGMKLLSIDNDYEYNNLQAALRSSNAIPAGNYWTSASDEGCEKAFGWCAVNKLVRNAIWASGQPENAGGKENCLVVGVDTNKAELQDEDCLKTFKYICEARDTTNSTTAGNAIKNECAAAFNLSESEVDNIFNSTNFDTKIKCFLKCVGENGGLILNGRLIDEGLIKIAEQMSSSNAEELQKNLVAVDNCAHIKGMDECDTAAQAYQCGQQQAPDLVANAIATVERNISAEEVPLPPEVAKCPTGFECVIDPVYRQNYEQNISMASSAIYFKRNVCGGKNFILFGTKSAHSGGSLCCKFGMRMVSLESQSKLDCVANLNFSVRPFKLWTSGSSLGKPTAPVWCGTNERLNISDFLWNSDTASSYSTVAANYLVALYVNTLGSNSYLVNALSTATDAYPFCED